MDDAEPKGRLFQTTDFCCSGLIQVREHLYAVEAMARDNKQEHIEHRASHERHQKEVLNELKEIRALASHDTKTWLYWILGAQGAVLLALLAWILNHLSTMT